MSNLNAASPQHSTAARNRSVERSTPAAQFSRCPHRAQREAAERAARRPVRPLPSNAVPAGPLTVPPAAPHVEPRTARRTAPIIAMLAPIAGMAVIAYVRWPHMADSMTHDLARLNGAWVAPAIALAAVSMLTAALQQRRVLRAGGLSLSLRSMLGISLAGNALSVTLPLAGSTAGTAFTYLQLKKRGAELTAAAWALAISGVISTMVLAVVLGIGAATTGDGATSVVGAAAVLLGVLPMLVLLMSFRSPSVRAYAERLASRVVERLHIRSRRASGLDSARVSRAFERIALLRLGWRAGTAAAA
jgi:hypothetical protein